MSVAAQVFRPVRSVLDRVFCVLFAILFAQGPVYIDQYLDVLAGSRLAAQESLQRLEELAEDNGLSADEFVSRLKENPDKLVRDSGEGYQGTIDQYEKYQKAYTAIHDSPAWEKPIQLVRYFDPAIHEAMIFDASVPLSWEGAVYGVVGLFVGWLFFSLGAGLLGAIFGGKKKKDKQVA